MPRRPRWVPRMTESKVPSATLRISFGFLFMVDLLSLDGPARRRGSSLRIVLRPVRVSSVQGPIRPKSYLISVIISSTALPRCRWERWIVRPQKVIHSTDPGVSVVDNFLGQNPAWHA